jgi:flagellar biosynthetic protein FliQ
MAAFWLGAPILVVAFITGVAVNIVQVATSMQDSAFSAVPRLAIFLFSFLVLGPWMLRQISSYTISLFSDLSRYAK